MTEPYRYLDVTTAPEHEHSEYAPAGHSHAKLDRLPDAETSQRVVYVSPVGSDTTGDGTSANRWKTIQHAIDQAETFLKPSTATTTYYKIVCATGTYSETVTVPANEFGTFNAAGEGGVWIISETGVKSDVVISSTGQWGVKFFGHGTADTITIENDTIAVLGFANSSITSFVTDCVVRRRSLSNGGAAGVYSGAGLVISINVSSEAGRLFARGLMARYGGVIAKTGTQPTGSTVNEDAGLGGEIR